MEIEGRVNQKLMRWRCVWKRMKDEKTYYLVSITEVSVKHNRMAIETQAMYRLMPLLILLFDQLHVLEYFGSRVAKYSRM